MRVDTAAYNEYVVTPYYDSLIAKMITFGRIAHEAISRMKRALEMTVVEGVKTTIPLHQRILSEQDFIEGRITTRFLERYKQRKPGFLSPARFFCVSKFWNFRSCIGRLPGVYLRDNFRTRHRDSPRVPGHG